MPKGFMTRGEAEGVQQAACTLDTYLTAPSIQVPRPPYAVMMPVGPIHGHQGAAPGVGRRAGSQAGALPGQAPCRQVCAQLSTTCP